MHSTMQQRLTGMIRGGLAVTLASTLMVPTAALANGATDSAGEDASQSSVANDQTSNGESSSLSEDELNSLLTPLGGSADEGEGDGSDGLLLDNQQDPNEQVTIIVELEEGGNQGVSLFSNLFGTQAKDRHAYFKDCIREVAAQQNGSDASSNGGIQLFSAATDDGSVEELYDYYNAIDGFAVKAPAGTLDSIKAMDGVKNAFIEVVHELPTDQGEQAGSVLDAGATELVTDEEGNSEGGETATTSAPKNQSSLTMTGADQASETGKGQTIAIIDSGLDTDHEAFTGDLDDNSVALTQDDVNTLKTKVQGKGATYVSEKIPFAYDYADGDGDVNPSSLSGMEHGTHVAGIAAANAGEIRGTAPDAQIIDMKVARNSTGGLPDSAILAALDDCVVIAPDSVNMSLGSDAGFSEEEAVTFGTALENVRKTGATVNVAAGNAYSSAYQNKSGSNLPYASDPDSSVMSTPAAIDDAFAVASVNNSATRNAFMAADGTKVAYSLISIYNTSSTGQDLSTLADGTYEIVDGGVGSSSDKSKLSKAYNGTLAGKIVAVQRGGEEKGSKISFTDKVKRMQELNASAIIIYNNEDGDLTNAAVDGITDFPPTVTISKADGEMLLAQETKTVTLKRDTLADSQSAYVMSDFSSWGVTPDLKLKPEVTAPGGNVYSSVVDGYSNMSGTSMATPQLAGISAQLHEYVENDAKFSGMSDEEKANVVTQLLMSTATPLADPSDSSSYYSPRKQGAGIANVPAATSTPVYLTVEGATDVSRPKADLGESATGTWSFTLTLHNVSDKAAKYNADVQALSDTVVNGLFQQKGKNWTDQGIDVTYSGVGANGSITVPANGTAQMTVNITCSDAFTSWAAENTPDGTFVEGYAFLKSADENGVDLSAPFMGFYGDWGTPNVFDAKLGSSDVHMYGSTLANPSGIPLGTNPLDTTNNQTGNYSIDENKIVVSNMAYSSAPSQALPLTGLLRNARTLTYEYKDADGNVVKSATKEYAGKSNYSLNAGAIYYAEARVGYTNFDGTDDSGARLSDGVYTLDESATVDGDGATQKLATYKIQYDTTAPVISNAKLTGEGDDRAYSFDVTDASYLAAFDFHDPTSGSYFYRVMEKDMPEPTVNEDGTKTWHFEVKAADVEKAWSSAMSAAGKSDPMPNAVALYAWDYGLNPSARTTAVMTPVAATSVTLSSTEVQLAAGQETTLTATVAPEDTTESDVVWNSSDESVASVDQSGKLTGVGNGQATVTVAVKDNPEIKAEAKVSVADVSESVGIVMSQVSAQVEPDATVEISAIVAPNLAGQDIEWSVGDSSVASIEVNADDPTKATLTGGSQIGDTQVTAKIAGKSAHMDVQVRPANYDDFQIDEETGTLEYYKGNASYVKIPNNVKVIGKSAFQGCPMSTVVIPTSVERIEEAGFRAASNLTSVIWEDADNSKCTYIGDQAFYYESKLAEIDLPKSVTTLGTSVFDTSVLERITMPGVTVIPENTFSQCSRLSDVTISDQVTEIGQGAFQSCASLGGFKILKADGSIDGGMPQALTKIGGIAFSGVKFNSVELPAGVKSIGDQAFAMTTALTTFKMNDGLESLGSAVFNGSAVSELDIPNSVTSFGRNALCYMGNLTRISFGKDVPADALTEAIIANPSLSQIQVPDDAVNYTVSDGVLFNKDMTKLVAFPAGMSVASSTYEVPATVESVEPYAFSITYASCLP